LELIRGAPATPAKLKPGGGFALQGWGTLS
jgi:hypothetical protein